MNNYAYLLCAAVGGSAPCLLRVAINCMKPVEEQIHLGSGYIFGLLVMAALGAGVGLIFKEKDWKRAFALGVSVPALVQGGLGDASKEKVSPTPAPQAHVWSLVGSAFAGESAPIAKSTNGPSRQVTLQADPRLKNVNVFARNKEGRTLCVYTVSSGSPTNVFVPATVDSLWITGDNFRGTAKELPPEPLKPTTISLEAEKNNFVGFQQAIGFRNVKAFDVDVRQTAGSTNR